PALRRNSAIRCRATSSCASGRSAKLWRFVWILRGSYTLGTVFSRRSSRDRSPNAVHALLATTGRPRFDLTGSNPTLAGIAYPAELLDVLTRAHADARVYRPEPFGLPMARE